MIYKNKFIRKSAYKNKYASRRKRSTFRRYSKSSRQSRSFNWAWKRNRGTPFRRFAYRINQIGRPIFNSTATGNADISSTTTVVKPYFPLPETSGLFPSHYRLGATIFARYWRIRGYFAVSESTVSVLRLIVVIPKFTTASSTDSLFSRLQGLSLISQLETEYFQVLEDRIVNLGTKDGGTRLNTSGKGYIPFNRCYKLMKSIFLDLANNPVNCYPPWIVLYSPQGTTPFPRFIYNHNLTWVNTI